MTEHPDIDQSGSENDETQEESCPEAQLLTSCECLCCTRSASPNQPGDVENSKQSYSHHSQQINKKKTY